MRKLKYIDIHKSSINQFIFIFNNEDFFLSLTKWFFYMIWNETKNEKKTSSSLSPYFISFFYDLINLFFFLLSLRLRIRSIRCVWWQVVMMTFIFIIIFFYLTDKNITLNWWLYKDFYYYYFLFWLSSLSTKSKLI